MTKVKGYSRRSRKGKIIKVKEYHRKGDKLAKNKPKPGSKAAGEELKQAMMQKEAPQDLQPKLPDWTPIDVGDGVVLRSREEAMEWQRQQKAKQMKPKEEYRPAPRSSMYGSRSAPLQPKSPPKPTRMEKLRKGYFARLEERLAKFVEKNGGTYKKQF